MFYYLSHKNFNVLFQKIYIPLLQRVLSLTPHPPHPSRNSSFGSLLPYLFLNTLCPLWGIRQQQSFFIYPYFVRYVVPHPK